MKQSVRRLVTLFQPEHYDLAISQDAEALTFSGVVTIHGTLRDSSLSTLTLHASDLGINSVRVNSLSALFEMNEALQELSITIPSDAQTSDSLDITIEFNGTITRPMHGLYPCFFTHDNKEKRLLATQFESHHAREVFPCIDEPEAKATFQLHLTVPKGDVVVSNTPIVSESVTGKLQTTTFDLTPKMSTYLLAWVSGELIYEEVTSKHGVTVRTYSTPVHAGKLAFSTETAAKALDFMDDYFAIPYPLAKCDQIALPDFAAGAMENWGCITYRESALLVDPEHSDLSDKQYASEVVIHELSHQWFGNLVTMRWWNDLWLNEGFASWVPYLVRDALFPEWKVWDHFATSDLAIGLRADALSNTHPIVVDINSPEEIRSAFDSISYDKGCSVINLLFHYIGADAFRDGLRTYLKTHAYSNAETFDLWSAWDASSGKDVSGFMQTWTESPGFPIVTVSDSHVSQSRFFINPSTSTDDTLWPIPLMRNQSDIEVLTDKQIPLVIDTKLNSGQSGFYRTIYTGALKDKLAESLGNGTLPSGDSLGLIADASEAAKAGFYSTTQVLDLIYSARQSTSEQLIGTILGELSEMRTVLADIYEAQKLFTMDVLRPNLERLGTYMIDSDTVDDQLLRPSILGSASYAGDKSVVSWALQMFDDAKSPEDIRPDVRGVVYQTAVREYNDEKTHAKLLKWYASNTIPGERTALAGALAGFRDKELSQKSLSLITTDEVKLQDSLYWVAYSLRNRWNKQLAWQWVQDNWDWVAQNFGKEKEIDYYLRFCASGFATKEHLHSYTEFFERVNIYGSTRAFEQGKETIQWQLSWKERDTTPVLEWLKHFTTR